MQNLVVCVARSEHKSKVTTLCSELWFMKHVKGAKVG